MDSKLRQILELALHPDTGNGESSAALGAARRLIAKHGVDAMLGEMRKPPSAVNKPESSTEVTVTVPAQYLHTMMERMMVDAPSLGVTVQLLSMQATNNRINSVTEIRIQVKGSRPAVDNYCRLASDYVDKIKTRLNNQTVPAAPKSTQNSDTKNRSWFSKLFGV